jgi:hypothetical protein
MSETTQGTARINASYGMKVPSKDVPFASEDVHMSISLDVAVDPEESIEVTMDRITAQVAMLATEVKLSVFAQLQVEPKEVAEGILVPDLSAFKAAEKPATGKGGGNSSYSGNRSNSGRGGAPASGGRPSSSGRQGARSGGSSTRVTLSGSIGWNGENVDGAEYYDNRPKKRSGDWKATAADFAPVDKDAGLPSLWMSKNGSPNEDVLDALEGAGIEYDWEEFA